MYTCKCISKIIPSYRCFVINAIYNYIGSCICVCASIAPWIVWGRVSARYILQQNMFHKLALNSQSFSTVRCPGPVIFCFKPDPLPVVSTMLKPNPKGTCRTHWRYYVCRGGGVSMQQKFVGSLPSRTFPINAWKTRKKLSAEIIFLAHEMRRETELREYPPWN